jgi:hypothetical protein
LLLNEGVSEGLFCLLVGNPATINMMSYFVNENVAQVEPAQIIQGMAGRKVEWMAQRKTQLFQYMP